MILSDKTIRAYIESGKLSITPFSSQNLQPASYDVHLGCEFRIFNKEAYECIDPRAKQPNLTKIVYVPILPVEEENEYIILHPGEFLLAETVERIKIPDSLVARLEGKSSLGRLALSVHSTAGFLDSGFEGTITLELSNSSGMPFKLYPKMRIGQVSFVMLTEACERPYGSSGLGSKYQGQSGPTESRSWMSEYLVTGESPYGVHKPFNVDEYKEHSDE